MAKDETAKEIWEHLERLYMQSNFVKQYQLEIEIQALKQKDMNIQEFYSMMTNLWHQLALTESIKLQAFAPYIAHREEQCLVQFFMTLHNDFEALHGTILYHNLLPYVDLVVSELLAKEIRLKSQVEKCILSTPHTSILAVLSRPPFKPLSRPPSNKSK